jgi:hypothetical protein
MGRRSTPANIRFARQYKIAANGCWVWASSLDPDGYGYFKGEMLGVKHKKAHRFSWSFHNESQIPAGMSVLHSCDNAACVNPDHLRVGTQADNIADRESRGRAADQRGEKAHQAKLTETQVFEIKALCKTMTDRELAAKFNVARTTISSIKHGHTWAHLELN